MKIIKAYLYIYREESKSKLGDNEVADKDDRKADKHKNIFLNLWQKIFRHIAYHTNQDGDGVRYYASHLLMFFIFKNKLV